MSRQISALWHAFSMTFPFRAGLGDVTELDLAILPQPKVVTGTADGEGLEGTPGDDLIEGLAGDDYLVGGAGDDTLDGGAGGDAIEAGGGDDLADGGNGNDWLEGGRGNDTLHGGAGRDALFGGNGRDLIFGGDGTDAIILDFGNDRIDGGDGFDVLGDSWEYGAVRITVDLRSAGPQDTGYGIDRISNVEGVLGGLARDRLIGNGGDNLLFGFNGNDTLRGNGGDDFLWGDTGRDLVVGGAGVDLVDGGDGNDLVRGNAGDDYVGGGLGADTLVGGTGDDIFIFNAGDSGTGAAERDVVRDFTRGEDRLALSGFGAGTVFTGTTAAENGVWYSVVDAGVILKVDDDGDGLADFKVKLNGLSGLGASDLEIGRFNEKDVDTTPFEDEGLWDALNSGFML